MSHTQSYIEALQSKFATGKATEHTYRAPMENYLQLLLEGVEATNESKRQACGMPDFVLSQLRKGQPIDVGYIEAKDIGVSLDKVEKSDQMKRYLHSLDNLILTDYLEFRFFRNQKKVATVRIAEVDNFFRFDGAVIKPLPQNFGQLEALLKDFVDYKGQTIKSARMLAEMMARKAQLMRNVFELALADKSRSTNSLADQLAAFRKILIHDMDEAQFADVYAQTIAYGLFTARLHDQTLESFTRQEALELIPLSNPFLRRLFQYVSLELDYRVVWIVDALCEVFRAANVHDILHDFGKQSGRNDPVVHFYETFLAEYDPKLRKSRGVWYTPEPVVNFIVRAVDEVLKTHFGLAEGLADTSKVSIDIEDQHIERGKKVKKKVEVHKVQLLDVAAGTGTFTAEAIKQIYAKFTGMEGMWSSYVEEHLLPRLHGFEILMASYAMCHLKIDMLLNELGYKPHDPHHPPRVGVYLTNALEEHHPDADTLFASWLANEANEANRIKRDMPIMVAYGNPPYSGHSANKNTWVDALLDVYKKEPGGKQRLNERNPKWLNDDYVKFLRLGEHYVERNGEGVLAYITNHGYLDNPTFRGMRWHLLKTFNDIYVIDLHGNAKKKEISPNGTPDKNVFDIQQGVAIIIAIKHGNRKGSLGQLHHMDMWGSRNAKYEALWDIGLNAKAFKTLAPYEPNYLFVPFDDELEKRYHEWFSVNALFPVNSVGIVTARDNLTIHFTKEEIQKIINGFANLHVENARTQYKLGKDTRDWKVHLAQEDLRNTGLNSANIVPITYRPFDNRYTYYTGKTKGFHCMPRGEVMPNMLQNNIGLIIPKQAYEDAGGFITKFIMGHKTYSAFNINTLFPLYLYPDTTKAQPSLDAAADDKRKPNLDAGIVNAIVGRLSIPFIPDHEDKAVDDHSRFSPLDLLDYIYAVLHNPSYREIYKEFLKIDFPRIPYPDNAETFWQLVALGSELRQFHLLEHAALAKPITTFPQAGDNMVEKPDYKNGRVSINQTQYFDGVPEAAWNFYIGGYQPAQKWLKDRKGRALNYEDVRHYQKIIVALVNTDRLMKEIDAVWQP